MRLGLVLLATIAACTHPPVAVEDAPQATPAPTLSPPPATHDAAPPSPPPSVDAAVAKPDDRPLHFVTKADLRALVAPDLPPDGGAGVEAALWSIAPEPGRFHQGNPANASHGISRDECRRHLQGVTLQTPQQRATCHGKANMVPVWKGDDPTKATACVDVFEFPNHACELPFVWGTPREADAICRAEGKRLCTQQEWTLACAGDPAGGPDRLYAYGDTLDLHVCNTSKPHPFGPDGQWLCSPHDAESTYRTCATETEPSGAFPDCRSRFGVYDLSGNVAEMMTRKGPPPENTVLTQLKGSAFFYVDVARAPDEPQKPGARETYPDHCKYDPRWHVEDLKESLHSNYHLGFRCCLGL
jgi:hypothetical protein